MQKLTKEIKVVNQLIERIVTSIDDYPTLFLDKQKEIEISADQE